MLDRSMLNNILNQVKTGAQGLNTKVDEKFGDNAGLAKGAALGGLAGLVLGSGGTLARVGGMAALGALAYKALNQNSDGAETAQNVEQLPAPDAQEEDRQTKLYLAAMIAAANADGHITAEEKGKITDALEKLDVSKEGRLFLLDEMMNPKGVREVVAGVQNEVEAGQVYLMSTMVIEKDDKDGQNYLSTLSMALGLDDTKVQSLEAALDAQVAS